MTGQYGDVLYIDIIALLVVGVFLLVAFVWWQWYLESVHTSEDRTALTSRWTPPPLMKLSVWGLAKGRIAVMFWIGFLEWFSFNSFSFWQQVLFFQAHPAKILD